MSKIVVLFEVKPTKEGMQKYLDLAAMLKPMLAGFEGFISAERFTSLNEEGKLLSMNVWTDEAAVERWRNVMQHRMSQKEGREKLFESYKITVCSTVREYTDKEREQAPKDSNQFFEVKDPKTAEQDACRMEHMISENSFRHLKQSMDKKK